jgi:hypothetical protein
MEKRVVFIKKLVSNPRLSDGTLEFSLEKFFDKVAEINGNQKWCALPDLNQRPIRYERTALTS